MEPEPEQTLYGLLPPTAEVMRDLLELSALPALRSSATQLLPPAAGGDGVAAPAAAKFEL